MICVLLMVKFLPSAEYIDVFFISCSSSRRWTITLLLGEAFLALVLYSFSLFTSGVVEMEGIGDMCSTKPGMLHSLTYSNYNE